MLLSQLGSAQNLPSSLSLVGWYHFPQTIRSIPRSRITSIRGFKTPIETGSGPRAGGGPPKAPWRRPQSKPKHGWGLWGEHGDRRHRPSSRPAVAFRDGQDGRDGRDAASACQASSFQNLRSCKILQGLLQGLQSLETRLASSSFVSLSVQACTSENSLKALEHPSWV